MGRQGTPIPEIKIKRIIYLLAYTDTPIPDIARRIGCTRTVVAMINRKHSIRAYNGKRANWRRAS